jgi:hypothetical protein
MQDGYQEDMKEVTKKLLLTNLKALVTEGDEIANLTHAIRALKVTVEVLDYDIYCDTSLLDKKKKQLAILQAELADVEKELILLQGVKAQETGFMRG